MYTPNVEERAIGFSGETISPPGWIIQPKYASSFEIRIPA
jgi:hypothetical protein